MVMIDYQLETDFQNVRNSVSDHHFIRILALDVLSILCNLDIVWQNTRLMWTREVHKYHIQCKSNLITELSHLFGWDFVNVTIGQEYFGLNFIKQGLQVHIKLSNILSHLIY